MSEIKKLANFRLEMLKAHNEVREKHQAPALEEDAKLGEFALEKARLLLFGGSAKELEDSERRKVEMNLGQNRSTGSNSYGIPNASRVVQQWHDERKKYSFTDRNLTHATAHFCQLVWKDSLRIGTGACFDPLKNKSEVVVVYQPRGNVTRDQHENILPEN